MNIHDQSAVIAFLSAPESYGEAGAVKIIETHISLVFLIDGRAYKLKRAVKLPYVDFSTYALRLHYCHREVELNGRATPDLYLGIRHITREADGTLVFDGKGEPLDVVVEMNRFAQHDLFDRMATEGKFDATLMEATARMIAAVHADAPVVRAGSGSANMAGVLEINAAGFATSHVFEPQAIARLNEAFRTSWAQWATLMDQRENEGKVRLCHGDLHLRNLFDSPAGPRMFDCIDFNDQIATIDILYDLAFLLMDLWHRGFPDFANIVVNRYLDISRDDEGFALLPFFMAVRAAVRAHVTGTQIEEGNDPDGKLTQDAKAYFDFAASLLVQGAPRLVAIGGLSGSGKSTLADRLAPRLAGPPGARLIESDRIRKAMFGVAANERLPLEAYRPDVSAKVYSTMADLARLVIAGGGTVVVNAVFDRTDDRNAIRAVAEQLHVPFTGLWLEAGASTLQSRIASRPKGQSDATLDVLERQLSKDLGPMDWHRVDAAGTIDAVLLAAETFLRQPS
ncbi:MULTISPECIES: AAA family ATPase [Alphaproteobacteria]|uniref:DNA-binding protein n=2 Tax=Alphaproteobacteria TaxID=28211 RepID=A0A512HN89_9HYPH|nr:MULTISPECIES: bifunctional aminoglycoside phosphotransferase/ATP-binding protein [Alphaproteobacteria]GEO86913.1 DNA-binding protein [Ciceribacter naphthalenivorans]GLR22227.1 DNA-binding protein [Ciceribacter naphthalenivorans]GLT05083.1 DNA-binding protein [Sphingomonas psychrolutea]